MAPALQNKILYSRGPGVTIESSRNDTVLGNQIQNGASLSDAVTAGRRTQIGSSSGNGQPGVYVTGVVRGTKVEGNAISNNTGDGVMLYKARRLMVGGSSVGSGNGIVANRNYGLYALGGCNGSVVQGNVIVANAQGNVNLTQSRGITYIPK